MPWQTMTAASALLAYDAADFNKIVDNLSYLKAGRPSGYQDASTAAWTIAAGAGTFEDDSDAANFLLTVVVSVQSTVRIFASARWYSDTARTSAFKMRVHNATAGTSSVDNGYAGTGTVSNRECYVVMGEFTGLAAGTHVFILEGARASATDTVVVEDRVMVGLVMAE